MAPTSRETIMLALFSLVTGVHDFVTTGRRLVMWDKVPKDQKPALFQVEHAETYSRQSETLRKRDIRATLFIYTDASDKTVDGIIELNTILDELDAALDPSGADQFSRGRQTLAAQNNGVPLVQHCFIDGEVIKDPGDLDGAGLLVVPIRILVP